MSGPAAFFQQGDIKYQTTVFLPHHISSWVHDTNPVGNAILSYLAQVASARVVLQVGTPCPVCWCLCALQHCITASLHHCINASYSGSLGRRTTVPLPPAPAVFCSRMRAVGYIHCVTILTHLQPNSFTTNGSRAMTRQ